MLSAVQSASYPPLWAIKEAQAAHAELEPLFQQQCVRGGIQQVPCFPITGKLSTGSVIRKLRL